MFNNQANSARFIYTISSTKPSLKNKYNRDIPSCHLRNGFYLTKEARSDEKVRYTETDITCIVRTVLFIHVFEISPENSLIEIVNSGQVSYNLEREFRIKNELNMPIIKKLLDLLFGDGFSFIVRRVIAKCFHEYNNVWRNYPYRNAILMPSAMDYLKLARFVNASLSRYTCPTKFILSNMNDHKISLQNNIKLLK